jgi:hypothetical protein
MAVGEFWMVDVESRWSLSREDTWTRARLGQAVAAAQATTAMNGVAAARATQAGDGAGATQATRRMTGVEGG